VDNHHIVKIVLEEASLKPGVEPFSETAHFISLHTTEKVQEVFIILKPEKDSKFSHSCDMKQPCRLLQDPHSYA
jgi:hypothetical protein